MEIDATPQPPRYGTPEYLRAAKRKSYRKHHALQLFRNAKYYFAPIIGKDEVDRICEQCPDDYAKAKALMKLRSLEVRAAARRQLLAV